MLSEQATKSVGAVFAAILIGSMSWAASGFLAAYAIEYADSIGLITGGRGDNEWFYQLELWGIRLMGVLTAVTILHSAWSAGLF